MTISKVVLAVVGAAGLAAAQNTISVKVDGVGECAALNWTFDAAQAVAPTGTGRPQITALVVNRQLDQCSPKLFQLVPLGQHLDSVVVTQYDSTGHIPVLTVTLRDVRVSNYQVGGSTASPLPGESVAFSFGSIKLEYRSPNGGGSIEAGYDFERNTRI